MKIEIKLVIWGTLVGGLPPILFGFSFFDWQWWIYILVVIVGAHWAFTES